MKKYGWIVSGTISVVMLLLLALAGCAPSAAPPTPTPLPPPTPTQVALTPADVVMGWADRLNAGDVEGALAYWADDGIWYIFGLPPSGSELIQGKENLRQEFANEIADNLKIQSEVKSVVGDVVTSHDMTWMDFTRQIGVAPMEATGQFLIEDGKIASYAWTPDAESANKLKAALAGMMPPEENTAAATQTPVSALAVTIADGTCSYEGPLSLKAGEVQLTVDVQDQDKEAYAVVFLTLEPGKDFMDLMASTTGTPPDWSQLLSYEEVGPGASATYTINVSDGPVYAICWSRPPDHPIGNFGPFEVSE